jgi:hypothetical protein
MNVDTLVAPRAWHLRLWLVPAAAAATALGACDSGADRPTRWSYLHAAIIRPSCATASCHSYQGFAGGLDLSTPGGAYSILTGRVCGAPDNPGEPPGSFVIPGQPERSRLLYLLRGQDTYVMPPDVPLPPVEVNLIESWILEGAPCDTAK